MAKTKPTPNTLFPILDNRRPVGLARLAAEATHTDDGHLIDFRAIQSRSILNKSVSKRSLQHSYSINPFRGCEFGCKYCFARYTHEFLDPAPITTPPIGTLDIPQQPWALAFEHEIYLKENAAWLLEQELRHIDRNEVIAIGTATDPYQPIERRVGITRSLLEVFARQEGYHLGIITKSSLITRDIDLLQQIAARNTLVLHITITTTDAALARKLEPRAPRPDLRFAALRKLRSAGLTAGVLCCPILPGINDSIPQLEAVVTRAAAAGASFLGANPLFLKSCSRPTFLSFVREHVPHLIDDYNRRYATADFVDAAYRNRMATITRQLCRKHHLGERSIEFPLARHVYTSSTQSAPSTAVQQQAQAKKPAHSSQASIQTNLFAAG